jgi:hypothetical protein
MQGRYTCSMGNSVYVVDYDIPREPAGKRVQFYRDLRKINTGLKYSTKSVFRIEEKELAEAVYWLVIAYGGIVNMYKGEEVFLSMLTPSTKCPFSIVLE